MVGSIIHIAGGKPITAKKPNSQLLQDMEEIDNQMKRLLARHETALNDQIIRRDVETLQRWLEFYRQAIAAASEISNTGTSWLADLRDRLQLAAEKMQMQGKEKEQAQKAKELLKVVHRIEDVIPNIDQLFVHKGTF